ncbi:MAG: uracil-DNA glycosylase family protein [Gemmatimonadetes bacterium]|nr:uracil-DNA glycosylase family protein [Gemmatimonadota bacterium]
MPAIIARRGAWSCCGRPAARRVPVGKRFDTLLREIRACEICAEHLADGPRPVVQCDPASRILIVGQAPGRKVHETGIPFNDPSGVKLREWMGVEPDTFYDPKKVALLPMGFCFPGTGKSGDLPPRTECAEAWRERLLAELKNVELTLVLGKYAQAYHLEKTYPSVTDAVKDWEAGWPERLTLPHPSPRNRLWLRRNEWFERDVIPRLQARIRELLGG